MRGRGGACFSKLFCRKSVVMSFNKTLLYSNSHHTPIARVAQSVERQALNLVVVGSSPTSGAVFFSSNYFRSFLGVYIVFFPINLSRIRWAEREREKALGEGGDGAARFA